jgi:hypothetical protein
MRTHGALTAHDRYAGKYATLDRQPARNRPLDVYELRQQLSGGSNVTSLPPVPMEHTNALDEDHHHFQTAGGVNGHNVPAHIQNDYGAMANWKNASSNESVNSQDGR